MAPVIENEREGYDAPRGLGLRSTTYYRVHQAILSDILSGKFKPGARLKIADLCQRYGLSAMPIREALQQLQGEGIVVISPNKGASVRPIDKRFVTDIYDVRSALYSIIYRDVIASADTAFDQTLVDIQREFDLGVKAGDVELCKKFNHRLHGVIESRCRNHEVAQLISRYSNMTRSFRDVFGYDLPRIARISEEHWAMIDAIKKRDVAAAVSAAQRHSQAALENMSRYFQGADE
ncbi:GntR family transcriptional regulator [Rhizobium laguerreae]|uniref:GntR family transcriptional regulator n=1 Tax=Rhizobium laguerreae TaxID=1076926 RepID=A0AB35FDF6_9HYPH|nr:GntR family transcriptional regulator [Rhizobium laguerreae]MBY3064694.1 GntR family transcriptional regulator [Rhizobium laguerreae]